MFFKRTHPPINWIIAGLGNPGKKYDGTRHNAGFAALDHVAKTWNIDLRKLKFDALTGTGSVNGQTILLLKPQTFMNLSGQSLLKATQFYKVPPQRVLVLSDDVALSPGTLRLRLNGSAGGHNGLKSIITFLGQDFPRLKIGVGNKPHPDYDMANWVLSRLTPTEATQITALYPNIISACTLLLSGDTSSAISKANSPQTNTPNTTKTKENPC